jgi:hypothetical protein
MLLSGSRQRPPAWLGPFGPERLACNAIRFHDLLPALSRGQTHFGWRRDHEDLRFKKWKRRMQNQDCALTRASSELRRLIDAGGTKVLSLTAGILRRATTAIKATLSMNEKDSYRSQVSCC